MTRDDELYIDSRVTKEKKDFPFFRGTERANRVQFLQRKRSKKDKVCKAAEPILKKKGKGLEVPVTLMTIEFKNFQRSYSSTFHKVFQGTLGFRNIMSQRHFMFKCLYNTTYSFLGKYTELVIIWKILKGHIAQNQINKKKTFNYVYLEVFQWILIENIFSLKYLLTPNRALGNPLETLT